MSVIKQLPDKFAQSENERHSHLGKAQSRLFKRQKLFYSLARSVNRALFTLFATFLDNFSF